MSQASDYKAIAAKVVSNIEKFYPPPGSVLIAHALKPMIESCPQAITGVDIVAQAHPGDSDKGFVDSFQFRFINRIGSMPEEKKRNFACMFISKQADAKIDKIATQEWWREIDFSNEMIKYVKTYGEDVHPAALLLVNVLRVIQASGWHVCAFTTTSQKVLDSVVGKNGVGVERSVDHDIMRVVFYNKYAVFKTISFCLDYSTLAAQLVAQKLMKDD